MVAVKDVKKDMNKNHLETMLKMQDNFNKVVNPDWRTAGYRWDDCIMMEAAELFDHYGYKHWKKQTPDLDQCRMELVDIWHFIMSSVLEHNKNIEDAIYEIKFAYGYWVTRENHITDTKENIRGLIRNAATGKIDFNAFFALLNAFDMDTDDLFKRYLGKNALNGFRQSKNYKSGEYIKDWNGREDNEVLTEILNKLDVNSTTFVSDVYAELEREYAEVC
jgi:dimeric dUTPase (all-alpha-NTP-PPase superfamily)